MLPELEAELVLDAEALLPVLAEEPALLLRLLVLPAELDALLLVPAPSLLASPLPPPPHAPSSPAQSRAPRARRAGNAFFMPESLIAGNVWIRSLVRIST